MFAFGIANFMEKWHLGLSPGSGPENEGPGGKPPHQKKLFSASARFSLHRSQRVTEFSQALPFVLFWYDAHQLRPKSFSVDHSFFLQQRPHSVRCNVAVIFAKNPSLVCFRRRLFKTWPLVGSPSLMCFVFGARKIRDRIQTILISKASRDPQ